MPGPRNLITDIPGLRVGNAHDERVLSGVTAVIFDKPNVASGITLGGAPGSRDTTLLEPEMTIQSLDAVVLSGGSLFGLDAAGGVVSFLRQEGRGVRIGTANVPIASQAIIFDLLNGGDKNWGRMPPYWELGWQAAEKASGRRFPAGHGGRRIRRKHRQLQGWPRLRERGDAFRIHRRRARHRECRWIGDDWRRAPLLGRRTRNRPRVWGARLAASRAGGGPINSG